MNLRVEPLLRGELAGLRETAAEVESHKLQVIVYLLSVFRSLQKPLFRTLGVGADVLAEALAVKDQAEIDVTGAVLDRLRSKNIKVWSDAAVEHCSGSSLANMIARLDLPLDLSQPAKITFTIRVEVGDEMGKRMKEEIKRAAVVLACRLGAKIEEMVPVN